MTEDLELRGYRPDQVEQGTEDLREAVGRGEAPLLPLPAGLVLRDEQYGYWAFGPRSQTWYRYSGSGWQVAEDPPTELEGLGVFGVWIPGGQPEAAAQPPVEAEYDDLVAGIESLVGRLRGAYYDSKLGHWQVETLLEQLAVVGADGEIWVPGFRKHNWYRWDGDRWAPQDGRPTVKDRAASTSWAYCGQCGGQLRAGLRFCVSCGAPVGEEEAPSASAQAIASEIEAGPDWIAEPLLADWRPPASFPEVLSCPQCNVLHLEAGQRCSVCAAGIPLRPGDAGPTYCHNCGSALRPGVKYCTECGARARVA